MRSFIDPEYDTVISAWGDYGEAGALVWVILKKYDGVLELMCIYEKDFTPEISALVDVTKAAKESMVNAVRSKYKAFNR